MDLLSMFKTLGAPTYFITLTADDMNWPDLLFALATRAGMEVTEESVCDLTAEKKTSFIAQ